MKSIVKNLFAAAFLLSLCCCSPKGDGSVSEVIVSGKKMYVFSLNSLKADTVILPLSSLLEDCRLVQLETNDDAYFRQWFTTVTEKYIGVRQQGGNPYKLFNSSGKFLCNVGSIGQGPGEYSGTLYDDIIDEKNELIYLSPFSGNKIYVFNTSGQHVKNIISPQWLAKPKIFLSDGILTVLHMAMKHENPNNPAANAANAIAIQFDVNTGEVLKQLAPPEHLIAKNFDGEIFNTRNATGIFDFVHTDSDTLYHFDVKDNRILPIFTMSYNSSEKPYKQYFQLNKDLFFTFVFGKGLVATNLKTKTSSWVKVVNDYYGNIPAPTYIIHLRNGFYVNNIQPEQLKDEIERRLSQKNCTDGDRQILKKIQSTLKEGDNNVVFVGKLKSDIKSILF